MEAQQNEIEHAIVELGVLVIGGMGVRALGTIHIALWPIE